MKKGLTILFLLVIHIYNMEAQEITVFPGFWNTEYYEDDQRIDKKDLKILFEKNQEVQAYWKKAKGKEIAFGIATAAEVGFIVWTYSELLNDSRSDLDNSKKAVGPLIGALGSIVIGAIFLNSANKAKKNAILTYNKQFDAKKTVFKLVPISGQNGLGLALKF